MQHGDRFNTHDIRPRLLGEFEGSALMDVSASGAKDCTSDFSSIIAERRVNHPVAAAITEHAFTQLFVQAGDG